MEKVYPARVTAIFHRDDIMGYEGVTDVTITELTVDERIAEIEKHYHPGAVPGTMLSRVMGSKGVVEWSLGIGALQAPKLFYTGATVDEVLTKAETYLAAAVKHYADKDDRVSKFAVRYGVVATALSDLGGGEMFGEEEDYA
jgi:hypothetical protein